MIGPRYLVVEEYGSHYIPLRGYWTRRAAERRRRRQVAFAQALRLPVGLTYRVTRRSS